jgi:hypothetical protein
VYLKPVHSNEEKRKESFDGRRARQNLSTWRAAQVLAFGVTASVPNPDGDLAELARDVAVTSM